MADPKRWAPRKEPSGRPVWDVYFFDDDGDHSYFVEMSKERAAKVAEYLRSLEEKKVIGVWHVVVATPEMDYGDLMEELREHFGE